MGYFCGYGFDKIFFLKFDFDVGTFISFWRS